MSDGRFWKIEADYKNLLFCENTILYGLTMKENVTLFSRGKQLTF